MSKNYALFNDDGLFQHVLFSGIHIIPEGAIEISDELSARILQQPDVVWRIDGAGTITATDPELILPTREQMEALRLRAYADPLTGSDRYFSEAQRMQVMGEEGWEEVRAAGVVRFEAIQRLYPWSSPDMAEPQ
ncbi:hypothetical protein [Pseudomonas lurida]|uniref:Phage tail protein n=1 Tax=Pseudomonas lurida TaxID=244566 RepID=A0ABY9FZ97_9PSED|nr:hypothetical protein [Pseudomonas lurida]WLH08655.1 hypothetical protein PSH67_08320 [Pseudomonas lurida]